MQPPKKYPLDYDSLKPGDVIPISKIEEISGKSRNHRMFNFEVMKLRDEIMKEIYERTEHHIEVGYREKMGGLVLFTEEQFVNVDGIAEQQLNQTFKKQRRLARNLGRVDYNKVSHELHEHAGKIRMKASLAARMKNKPVVTVEMESNPKQVQGNGSR